MTYRQEIITSRHTTELGFKLTTFWSQMQDLKMPLKTKLVQFFFFFFLHLPISVMEINMILSQKMFWIYSLANHFYGKIIKVKKEINNVIHFYNNAYHCASFLGRPPEEERRHHYHKLQPSTSPTRELVLPGEELLLPLSLPPWQLLWLPGKHTHINSYTHTVVVWVQKSGPATKNKKWPWLCFISPPQALNFHGRLKYLHGQNKMAEDGTMVHPQLALFAIATPLQPPSILEIRSKTLIFQTKHKLDFTPTGIDTRWPHRVTAAIKALFFSVTLI